MGERIKPPNAQAASSSQTRELIDVWLEYGNRPKVVEAPQRTRFQGSKFDFNGDPLTDQ